MIRTTLLGITTAALLVTGLAGCALTGTPVSAESPLPSDTLPVITPTTTPEPVPQPTGEPLPQNTEAAPDDESTVAPPADWNADELAGACKQAWIESGSVTDWSVYSPDVTTEPRGDAWYVAITSTSGADVRDCTITGTPDAPQVALGS